MSRCSWSGISYGMDINRDSEDQRQRSCNFTSCVSTQPHFDPFLLLVLFVGSIIWYHNQTAAIQRKTDNLKNYDIHSYHSRADHFQTISEQLQKLDATLKELTQKISGLQIDSKVKIEFPHFSGIGPAEWLNRVAQFFKYNGTPEDEGVTLASFYLEGEANQWLQWLQQTSKRDGSDITWEFFKKELVSRFGPAEDEDFNEALSRVKQSGSLRDYRREIERLSNRVVDWPDKELNWTFMGGLKEEISGEIKMSNPRRLRETIDLARTRDELLSRQSSSSNSGYISQN
ncbi:hypothetical protein GH714_031690 [Hevea brasiliensis]|uniref:Retrotransposon gag domain-containing protein n=1 Tax=Hevea brasiliensis TaxID=3981 RepID=A0A6A6M292_HEVBR|nr:hypothetical protein GH714_031690 [Hevea brasiliensis]